MHVWDCTVQRRLSLTFIFYELLQHTPEPEIRECNDVHESDTIKNKNHGRTGEARSFTQKFKTRKHELGEHTVTRIKSNKFT